MDPGHQEKPEDNWWNSQITLLAAGVICGVLANFLFRRQGESDMGNRIPSVTRRASFSTNHKMVLVVRTDLGMGKGKAAAQCAHAAVGCYRKTMKENPQMLKQWEAKVTVKGESEEQLIELRALAQAKGITACLIHNAKPKFKVELLRCLEWARLLQKC